jgi:hypothetical protein
MAGYRRRELLSASTFAELAIDEFKKPRKLESGSQSRQNVNRCYIQSAALSTRVARYNAHLGLEKCIYKWYVHTYTCLCGILAVVTCGMVRHWATRTTDPLFDLLMIAP